METGGHPRHSCRHGQFPTTPKQYHGAPVSPSATTVGKKSHLYGKCFGLAHHHPPLRTTVPGVSELTSIRADSLVQDALILRLLQLPLDPCGHLCDYRTLHCSQGRSSLGGDGRVHNEHLTASTLDHGAKSTGGPSPPAETTDTYRHTGPLVHRQTSVWTLSAAIPSDTRGPMGPPIGSNRHNPGGYTGFSTPGGTTEASGGQCSDATSVLCKSTAPHVLPHVRRMPTTTQTMVA